MAVPGSFNLQLERFTRNFLRQAGESAESLTDQIVVEAKRIAPVGRYPPSSGRTGGTYRASIRKERQLSLSGLVGAAFGRGQGIHSYFVVSDVPYAEALELGHSKQAPHGVFSVATATVRSRYGLR